MNSLEWRVKKLENLIFGKTAGAAHVDRILSQSSDQASIQDQLNSVAKHYANFINNCDNYSKFRELYSKYSSLALDTNDGDAASKAELVLAYEDDIHKYMQDLKSMADKADRVLDIKSWPDLSGYKQRIDKLQQITKEQHLQSLSVDDKTEDIIQIYNDIIGSFKSNMNIWNQKLEDLEAAEQERNNDE